MSEPHPRPTRDELLARIRSLEENVGKERELHALVHELQVHQEEIRVQNTQLQEAQTELEEARDRYANLYDFAPVAYVTLDGNGIIQEINLTGAKLLKSDRRMVVGSPLNLFVADGDRMKVFEHLRSCKETRGMVLSEMGLKPRDGSLVPIRLVTAGPSTDSKQTVFHTAIWDLTETIRLEEERTRLINKERTSEARNEAKDRFLAVLSHELRTPLTPILAIIGDLESMPGLSAQQRADLLMIHRNIELEARLIDDLLDLTRISRGKLQLYPRTIDVHEMIGYVLETLKENFQGRQLTLTTRLEAQDRHVTADPGRLQQILWNILKNAIKFTPDGGRIVILTRNVAPIGPPARTAKRLPIAIEITDSGIGIEPHKLPKLFNAFEQIDQAITREYGGLGLGLAISRGLVQAHGGRITASSPGKDNGSTFQVELNTVESFPVAEMAGVPDAGSARTQYTRAPGSGRPRVLLVEDHHDTAMIFSRLLKNRGFEVHAAHSLKSAAAVDAGSFDLVISDLGLPDGSGLELMRQLHARNSRLVGIALSGFGTEQDIQRSQEAGFTEHLTKPVDFQSIMTTIERVMNDAVKSK